jgi:hypothetical protein
MKLGFSLIECLLYLTLSVIGSLLFACVVASLVSVRQRLIGSDWLDLIIVQERLAQDFFTISDQNNMWLHISTDEIVWHNPDKDLDYGWRLRGRQLSRSYGVFNEQQKCWVKRTESTLCNRIESFVVIPAYEGMRIRGIWCTVSTLSGSLKRFIACGQRRSYAIDYH